MTKGPRKPKRRSPTVINRKIHQWGSILIALPLVIVLITGVLLLLKMDFAWIQPTTIKGEEKGLALNFDQVLAIARTVPAAGIETWADVEAIVARSLEVQSRLWPATKRAVEAEPGLAAPLIMENVLREI